MNRMALTDIVLVYSHSIAEYSAELGLSIRIARSLICAPLICIVFLQLN